MAACLIIRARFQHLMHAYLLIVSGGCFSLCEVLPHNLTRKFECYCKLECHCAN